jgi:hypothetical protein
MSQKIIISTLPWKDYTGNKWMLSASVSIQLDATGGATLSGYPDILQWLDRLQGAVFFVQWNNDKPQDITVTNTYWDATLYQNLFSPGLVVKPFQLLNVSGISLKSYPVGHIRDFILNTYNEVGNLTPAVLPTAGFYVNQYKKLADISRVQLVTKPPATGHGPVALKDMVTTGHPGKVQAAQQIGRNKVIPFSNQANPSLDFGQFHNYFDPGLNAGLHAPPAPPKPALEYHDILSIIMDYPIIQRKLGLVLDFELAGPPAATSGFVRIIPTNLSFQNDLALSTPPTAYEATSAGFYMAAKSGSTIDKGALLLNSPNFSVVEIDTEGSAMKLTGHSDSVYFSVAQTSVKTSNKLAMTPMVTEKKVNGRPLPKLMAANGQEQAPAPPPEDDGSEQGLPALRSAGIGIIHNGLAAELAGKLTRMSGLYKNLVKPEAAVNNTVLYNRMVGGPRPGAGNVVAGVGGAREVAPARLQELRSVVLNPKNVPMPSDTLYADDLVRGYRIDIAYDTAPGTWYSLHQRINQYAFAPLHGTAQPVSLPASPFIDEGCIQLSLTQDSNDPSGAQKLNEVIARWEGWSLTVPRPGKSLNNTGDPVSSDADEQKKYQLDDSVSFRLQVNTTPAPKTLPRLRFGLSYSVKIRTVDLGGNSLPSQMDPENKSGSVISGIRYLRYEPLPVAVLREGNEVASGGSPGGDRDGESLELMVIRSNVNVTADQYEKNNPTTLYTNNQPAGTVSWLPQAVRHVLAPPGSQLLAETHGMFDVAFKDPTQAPSFYQFISSRDKPTVNNPAQGRAPVYPVTQQQVDIDWLADPMAAGVILTMETMTSFETPWQKGASHQFSFYFDDEVTAANAGTAYSVDQWKTPRSFRIILVEGNGAPVWNASSRSFTIALPKSAQVLINYACFWRPDDLPAVSGMHACVNKAGVGTQAAQLALRGLHWMFSPWRTIRLVHAVQQPLQAPQFGHNVSQITKDYGNTFIYITTRFSVHGSSTDKVDISANWTEWTDDLTGSGPKQVNNSTHVDTIQVAYTDTMIACVIATRIGASGPIVTLKGPIYQAFGDTRHRMIDYIPVATTRYREYFAGLVAAAAVTKQAFPLTQAGAVATLNILSSARPIIPAIEYLLPSFNWGTTTKGNTITHIRTGNIRVYVKRPWYSSGDDERLGVVLAPKGANIGGAPSLARYCTAWGMDPVFAAPALNNSNYPTRDNFPYAADYDTVRLAEDNNTMVDVAGYAVGYDPDKQLYFFDIPVNILSAYFPFVKLTLARYQRNSLRISGTDVCLSKLVSADWVQVVPARETAIMTNPGKSNFTVTLNGTAPFGTGNSRYLMADNEGTRTRIRVQVQNAVIPKSEDALIAIDAPGPGTVVWEKDFDISLSAMKNGQIQFSTAVQLDRQWAGKPYRVMISEYELHQFDPLRTVQLTKIGQPRSNQPVEWSERLVFMDMFEVNGSV